MEQSLNLEFAKLDLSRPERTGMPETVYCAGKTGGQLVGILRAFAERGVAVLATKCSPQQAEMVQSEGLPVRYDAMSRVLALGDPKGSRLGKVAVCTGGTSDMPVAEEAAQTASFFGAEVARFYDIGVAGLHRLLASLGDIRKADVVIAVAGMEGALASVVAGLVGCPVIAVPTSVGYGAAFQGLAPLLGMLTSCAEGVTVVNIDNGFGAAVAACRMLGVGKQTEK